MAVCVHKLGKKAMVGGLKKFVFAGLAVVALAILPAFPAFAVATASDVAESMVETSAKLPFLLAGLSYLLGLVFAVTGVFKLKEHVDNADKTPLRVPITRFITGGALFSLPIVTSAMKSLFDPAGTGEFDPGSFTISGFISGALGELASFLGGLFGGGAVSIPDINGVLASIIASIEGLPGLIAAAAYLLGIVAAVAGVLKIREHVENPDQTPLREGVVRLIFGGAMFALPTIYTAMASLISGEGLGLLGVVGDAFASLGFFYSSYGGGMDGLCNPVGGFVSNKLGATLCGVFTHAGAFPAFLSALSYLFGLVLGLWGILKIRDHVLNPNQTSVWEGVSRLVAGGMFFSLPVMIAIARSMMTSTLSSGLATFAATSGYNEGDYDCDVSNGLDGALYCMMSDLLGPIHVVTNFFTFVAGIIFIMIGISRLTKSAQDGPRGPGGLGTMVTFLAGGALISYNELIRVFTGTLSFGSLGGLLPITSTYATLTYVEGMDEAETLHAHTVISAILKFMIVIGFISFVRGIFIIRGVAEGNNQSSVMAGITHLVGGALAVNLGPLLNAVQATLGIAGYGITFS